jgi:hypothetical protein
MRVCYFPVLVLLAFVSNNYTTSFIYDKYPLFYKIQSIQGRLSLDINSKLIIR